MCLSITFSQFSLTKNQNIYMENGQFKHMKLYSESGLLCSWMTFSYSCVLFSNWNWLVCSSSVLNVMRIWGWEAFCLLETCVEWPGRILLSAEVFVALKFLSKLSWLKKIMNYLSFETLQCCPFCCYSGGGFSLHFSVLGEKRNGAWILACGEGFMLFVLYAFTL